MTMIDNSIHFEHGGSDYQSVAPPPPPANKDK